MTEPRPGACCLSSGECTFVVESACSSNGGTFRGQDAPCASADCPPPPTGACCLPSAINCEVTTRQRCTELSGGYQGDETTCEPSPCVPQSGACCLGGKGGVECYIKTQADCEDSLGGYYAGDGTTCSVENCGGPPLGACCLWYDGSSYCSLTVQAECEQLSGEYFGDWTSCAGVECAPPPGIGACCLPGGTQAVCVPMSGGSCLKFGGVFFGPGSQCDMARCGIIDLWETAEYDFHADAPFPRNRYRVYPPGGGGQPSPLSDGQDDPELVFDAPGDGIVRVVGEPVNIGWAARDDGDDARIWILLEPAIGLPGDSIIVRSAVSENDANDRSASIDTSGLTPGEYLLIGVIANGRTMNIVRGPSIHIGSPGETSGAEMGGR
ncbi:MAG: hypothetical protein JNG88_16035 [Phycisphaerales bacterium]|nr:hypothetical protein [Phycisphaerales bacterium]